MTAQGREAARLQRDWKQRFDQSLIQTIFYL